MPPNDGMAEIRERLGELSSAMSAHEAADERRHEDLCGRIGALEKRQEEAARAELQAAQKRVAELEAERKTAEAGAKARRHDWAKGLALLVVGAVLSLAGGALTRAADKASPTAAPAPAPVAPASTSTPNPRNP